MLLPYTHEHSYTCKGQLLTFTLPHLFLPKVQPKKTHVQTLTWPPLLPIYEIPYERLQISADTCSSKEHSHATSNKIQSKNMHSKSHMISAPYHHLFISPTRIYKVTWNRTSHEHLKQPSLFLLQYTTWLFMVKSIPFLYVTIMSHQHSYHNTNKSPFENLVYIQLSPSFSIENKGWWRNTQKQTMLSFCYCKARWWKLITDLDSLWNL